MCNDFDEYSSKAKLIQQNIKIMINQKTIKQEPSIELDHNYETTEMIEETIIESLNEIEEEPKKTQKSKRVKQKIKMDSEKQKIKQVADFEYFEEGIEKEILGIKSCKKRGRSPKIPPGSIISCTEPNCPRKFSNIRRFHAHVRYHATSRNFKCDLCEKTFKTFGCVQTHKKFVHSEKFMICDACGKNFGRRSGLVKHFQAVHLNMKRFVCSTCGLAYNSSSSLKCHQFTHEPNNKPEVCQICEVRFYSKSKLERHMRTHTGIKNYECEICFRKFAHRYNVTAHLKSVHRLGIEEINKPPPPPIICQLCGKIFERKKHLNDHLKNVHETVPLNQNFNEAEDVTYF